MTSTRRTSHYSSRLDTEWNRTRTCRRALHRARSWAATDPAHPLAAVVEDVTDLAIVIAATQRGAPDNDAIMLRLVELARTDELAGRIVIQRLLPGLISRSIRHRSFHERVDPVELVVPAAWLALRTYDTDRRRRHVASSLISDSVFAAFRAPRRRRSTTEVSRSPHHFDEAAATIPSRSTLEELADAVSIARRAGVPTTDLDLLCRLVQVESPSIVARERHVTARTVRNHRDRAVERVRLAVAA